MKQYTNESQTAKLIELGFERPKNRLVKQRFDRSTSSWIVIGEEGNYSIGELIEMLPRKIGDGWYLLQIKVYLEQWKVLYIDITNDSPRYYIVEDDLIDAIFNMIIKLKEEEVI